MSFISVHSCLSSSLLTAINIINQDDDRYVVLACLEVLEELFKVLKGDAFPEKNHVVKFNNALWNIFKGKVSSCFVFQPLLVSLQKRYRLFLCCVKKPDGFRCECSSEISLL